MNSAAKGKGHDHYIRAAKQQVSQTRADVWKAALARREKEREKDGTVGDKTLYGGKGKPFATESSSSSGSLSYRIHSAVSQHQRMRADNASRPG